MARKRVKFVPFVPFLVSHRELLVELHGATANRPRFGYTRVIMDEAALVTLAKKGDIAAFNELILTHQSAVYNFALRFTGDPASADDAAQETFIAAYRALHQFDKGNFKGWLIRIVHNKCRDRWRKQKRHPTPSLDEMLDENPSRPFMSDGATPESHSTKSDIVQAVENCLDTLPENQRSALILRDVEGYDYAEVADILSCSLGTVKSRLNRGRRRMQDCLQGFAELLPARYRLGSEAS